MIDPTATVANLSVLPDAADSLEKARSTREAGAAFESYLYTFLAKNLRSTVPDGPFSSGAMSTFSELFDQEIGRQVGEAGLLGLSAQLEQSLALHGLDGSPVQPKVLPQDGAHPELGVDGVLTSGFGMRADPIHGKARFHQGVDIGARSGAPIHAVQPGKVIFAGQSGGFGNLVVLDHGDGLVTRYAHCSQIGVVEGQQVGENEVIGAVGSTGHSTGPHLHFEVRKNGEAVDPLSFRWKPVQEEGG
ncbi:MAG TPA: peptidoglycan DD-metalloendopeptidase family protein [Myxococcota bacterium]|nr:peptidoglycan DD-metalloendopeptidase family protein [Myxococcota bacterium]HNH45440.1 peptidoglycan DD-metalloendopeptidase family protein [Myxococcota bacterium]